VGVSVSGTAVGVLIGVIVGVCVGVAGGVSVGPIAVRNGVCVASSAIVTDGRGVFVGDVLASIGV
jgi:hypothetical protein